MLQDQIKKAYVCTASWLVFHARLLKDVFRAEIVLHRPSYYQTPSPLFFHGETVHGRMATYIHAFPCGFYVDNLAYGNL